MLDISEKANRVLHLVLVVFILIGVRIWYLTTIAYETHLSLAQKPQQRTVIEIPERGTIRDRFNIPLAINQIKYNACITYDAIGRLPRIQWKMAEGKRQKKFYRKEYIAAFSHHLAKELQLDPQHVEDLIYSKAAIFPHTPYAVKENLTEEQFYRLVAQEKDWPGLCIQLTSKRCYPQKATASHILGYMGAINPTKYQAIQQEISQYTEFLKDREDSLPVPLPKGFDSIQGVKQRLEALKSRSYTIHSLIGKGGVEGRYDAQLRGICGKKKYEVDIRGSVLGELPETTRAVPGRRLILTLSSELQAYAEHLLMENESTRHQMFATAGKNHHTVPEPWIKGGSIIAMLPKTGEVVAMASYPNFDPNDFIEGNAQKIAKWLETPNYIGKLWDGAVPLERQLLKGIIPHTDSLHLSWAAYLNSILFSHSKIKKAFYSLDNLYQLIEMQHIVDNALELLSLPSPHLFFDALFPSEQDHILTSQATDTEKKKHILNTLSSLPQWDAQALQLQKFLLPKHNEDKILLLDLCRLLAPASSFTTCTFPITKCLTPQEYRKVTQYGVQLRAALEKWCKHQFHNTEFAQWREEHFTEYLKLKRKEEKGLKLYHRPYLEHLQEKEEELLKTFMQKYSSIFFCILITQSIPPDLPAEASAIAEQLLTQQNTFHPLFLDTLRTLLQDYPFDTIDAFLRTLCPYADLQQKLYGTYPNLPQKNSIATTQDLARAFYPSSGWAYSRSHAFQDVVPMGSAFKLITGYEALRQHYLANSDKPGFQMNPLTVIDDSPPYHEKLHTHSVLGNSLSGVPITRYYKGGIMPRGHPHIGKVDFRRAFVRSSNLYFSLLAAEHIQQPQDLLNTCKLWGLGPNKTHIDLPGEASGALPGDLLDNKTGLYAFAIGQHSLTVTPLQTAIFLSALANQGIKHKPQIVKMIANYEPDTTFCNPLLQSSYPYQEYLNAIGITYPLFTEPLQVPETPYIQTTKPEITEQIFCPPPVHTYLMHTLKDVINHPEGTARYQSIVSLLQNAKKRNDYLSIKDSLGGKTSTAEIAYRPCLEREGKTINCKHVWFSSLHFQDPQIFTDPELVVIVLLRYGNYGKEAAPLAAQVAKKWQEILAKHSYSSLNIDEENAQF